MDHDLGALAPPLRRTRLGSGLGVGLGGGVGFGFGFGVGAVEEAGCGVGVGHQLDRTGAELVHGRHVVLVGWDMVLGQSGRDHGGGLVEQLRGRGRQPHPHALDISTQGGAIDSAKCLADTTTAQPHSLSCFVGGDTGAVGVGVGLDDLGLGDHQHPPR
ncbi:hypothetical protein E9934_08575 [Nocardioides caeni]|uniref:Uncharacterized protein n=1 Tax=Nocardioides caeni TaxID=574700 RepID=A0A4S8NE25_9ACTN|nr:hypothetical protein E9934_08575 [Nocardioides caeni]